MAGAAGRAGGPSWEMPLPADLRKGLESEIADLVNTGPREGGMLTAGLFLKEFVTEGVTLAHRDIAAPASHSAPAHHSTPRRVPRRPGPRRSRALPPPGPVLGRPGTSVRPLQCSPVGHRHPGWQRRSPRPVTFQSHPAAGERRHRTRQQRRQERPAGPGARHTVLRGHGLDDGMTAIDGCGHRVGADTLASTTTAGTGARGDGIREERERGGGS